MILLDTHTVYWFLTEDERLPESVKKRIEQDKDVYISIVSFWEMAIKNSIGKLELPAPVSVMIALCENNYLINGCQAAPVFNSMPKVYHVAR